MKYVYDDFLKSANFIKEKMQSFKPKIAIILGSGQGDFAENIKNPIIVDYSEIPNFPKTTTVSHSGRLFIGKINDVDVMIMQGRFHYYEGYEFSELAFPIGVFKILGIEKLILSNAAGGINESFEKGDFMIVTDHIKFANDSPVRGININELGERFFDMTNVYDKDFIRIACECAKKQGMDIKQGVYAYMAGPQYETAAEIKALRILGADAVGMSTVSEVIMAAHCGLKVLCISSITNQAAGMSEVLTHSGVTKAAGESKKHFAELLKEILRYL